MKQGPLFDALVSIKMKVVRAIEDTEQVIWDKELHHVLPDYLEHTERILEQVLDEVKEINRDFKPLELEKKLNLASVDGPVSASMVASLGSDHRLVEDDYHNLIFQGASWLNSRGFGHFEYLTGWSSSTLWRDPNSDGTITVYSDGRIQ